MELDLIWPISNRSHTHTNTATHTYRYTPRLLGVDKNQIKSCFAAIWCLSVLALLCIFRFLCHCRLFLVYLLHASFFPSAFHCTALHCFCLVWIVMSKKVVPCHNPVVLVTCALCSLRVAPLTSVLRLQSALSWALSKKQTHNHFRLIAWKQIKLHQTAFDYYIIVIFLTWRGLFLLS